MAGTFGKRNNGKTKGVKSSELKVKNGEGANSRALSARQVLALLGGMEGKGDEDNVERGWKNRLNRWHDHGGLEIWHQIATCQCVRNLAWGHVTKQPLEMRTRGRRCGACALSKLEESRQNLRRAEVARGISTARLTIALRPHEAHIAPGYGYRDLFTGMNRISSLGSLIRHAIMSTPKLSPPSQPLVVVLGSTGTGKSDVCGTQAL